MIKKWLPVIWCTVFIIGLTSLRDLPTASAENLSDGVYTVDYELLQGDRDSVSIANDYFAKPALLKVKGDKRYMQLTVNHSEWVKELQAPTGDQFKDVDVVGEDEEANTRTVQFEVENGAMEAFPMKMHVSIEEMEPVYDHAYTVRINVDLDSATTDETGWVESSSTGFTGTTILYIVIAVIAAAFLVAVLRLTRSKKKESKLKGE